MTGVMVSMEIIKPPMNRTVGNGGSNGCPALFLENFSALGVLILKIEVPFADDGSRIPFGFEQAGNCQTILGDQTGGEALDYSILQAGPPRVAAGKKAVTGGGADGRAGMSIGKDHSFSGELVDMGGLDFPILGIETLHISVAQVVTHDKDDIGPALTEASP